MELVKKLSKNGTTIILLHLGIRVNIKIWKTHLQEFIQAVLLMSVFEQRLSFQTL